MCFCLLVGLKCLYGSVMDYFLKLFGGRSVNTTVDCKPTMPIVSIAINDSFHAESSLYRLNRKTTLHIVPGASLLGRRVALYCNVPVTDKGEFIRLQYVHLNWFNRHGKKLTDEYHPHTEIKELDVYCEIEIRRAGSFHFYFTYDGSDSTTPQGSFYIQIEPNITVGADGSSQVIPLDAIRCQTVLSKCLGPLSSWDSKLIVSKNSGYNVIHFTPVQELGASRSGYSIANQHRVNPEFSDVSKSNAKTAPGPTFDDLEKVIKRMRANWGIASICDIVLNHTANESEWIHDHPEAAYSCFTCPYLRPAFLLDALLAQVTVDTKAGLLETVGVPQIVETEDHLQALKYQLHTVYLPKVRLWEFYQVDVEKYFQKFYEKMQNSSPPTAHTRQASPTEITLLQDPEYRRLGCTIDFDAAYAKYNVFSPDVFDEDSRLRKCAAAFRNKLEQLNEVARNEINDYLNYAVENCLASIRYERVEPFGPKVKEISLQYPLLSVYFTDGGMKGVAPLTDIEPAMYTDKGKYFMAHNGWVMNADPLLDFAAQQPGRGNVYLKRELISWGDSIKLRFGEKPADSPYLWNYMKEYVATTAKIFDGVRLDNCHSTPLHVAEYLLDCAREVNPELYVVAELFTNSDQTDNIFVNRLGITSLIREAQSAWDSHEEGRLVYRYGGAPVGAFYNSVERPLAPTIAHALFLDITHDNPSPIEKRSVFDLLPSAALVSMACCATGSTRGYDELVPHHIHVVNEERQYQEWNKGVDAKSGIIAAKRAINILHGNLVQEGLNQVYVDQMDVNVVAVTRHSPDNHQTVILVAHTSFQNPEPNAGPSNVRPLVFEGDLEEIIFEAELTHNSGKPFDRPYNFEKNPKFINGLTEYELKISEHIPLVQSNIFKHTAVKDGNVTKLEFGNLRPGSVIAVRVRPHQHVIPHFANLDDLVRSFMSKQFGTRANELKTIVSKLDLNDLNKAIYCCDQEERDAGNGGVYNIPGYGPLVYSGSQGFNSLLSVIGPNNDLGHPICCNLREGNWMIDYIHERLNKYPGTVELAKWIDVNTKSLKEIPRYLIPSYFDVIYTGIHDLLIGQSHNLMSEFIKNGSGFEKYLALGSLQFVAVSPSCDLPKLSPKTSPPLPPSRCSTISAGLPHFSTGYMRTWGRDTFISLRGLLILTGRYDEARYHILGFGSCLRHGLMPNLLDNGTTPRFNCRDAIWWWMHSIKQYVTEVPNGQAILTESVSRIFPTDDSEHRNAGEVDQPLFDIMQEALTTHFQGLIFRERNAGKAIDEHMLDGGFNNQIGIHPTTGFVFGGNVLNCGTWMDKMGSSERAGNKGIPSTPRDGSAVELVGLQMAVLRFMDDLGKRKLIPYQSVERTGKNGEKTTWTYEHWANLIADNFETNFFVSNQCTDPLVNKRGIYKDSLGASKAWADFQLRCNFPIAMVVAPELFDPNHAWQALELAKKHLVGPLGMKTLDPDDFEYRGFYDNSNDSDDPHVSHGSNYHQGPEWLWPIGFYLRARLIFAKKTNRLPETVAETWSILTKHLHEIQTSPWRGLPELTNENGSYCVDSCRTQAWSMATILEVVKDLKQIDSYK
ncbi:glycogen debranching enzyme isoform X3 [Bradysia coprophila]|uniref:glycogen debranching enzyme isoform X3 n=1 Tax=Bradysia coprophila TaxID=38358 RepID=UPI00187D91D2|nr:glycogen debranching enzyme isoform X3 [Bradysia coprophila]